MKRMSRADDSEDLEWRRVTSAVACELAQRIFDTKRGCEPVVFKEQLERVVGAPWSRMLMQVDRRSGRVVEVVVLPVGDAVAHAFEPLRRRTAMRYGVPLC